MAIALKHRVTKREYAEVYEDYKEVFREDELDEPIMLKWAIAAEFCNDKSIKEGLQPCYYLNGEIVDSAKGNYDIRGENYECRTENNGYRIPPSRFLVDDDQWSNDEGEWAESITVVRTIKVSQDPEEKHSFKICYNLPYGA